MLSPYRVLDLTNERGQLCGQVLGDMAADVILVEPPGGSTSRRIGPFVDDNPDLERSLFFWATNRNKRSITLDLGTADGRDLFRRLAVKADFLVESFEPGHLDSLGLGFDALSTLNPGLILASITPFGQTGPKARWPASDLTVLASTGALLLTGDDDRPPVRVAVPQAFFHASAEAVAGALMALHARSRDGLGQHVDVSAQAATMMATQSFVLAAQWGDFELRRSSGGLKLGPLNLRFVYPASDGYVSVTFLFGTAIGPFTRRLMEQMYAEGFVDEATRDKDWMNYTVLLLTGQEPSSELDRCCDAIAAWCRAHAKRELFEMALDKNLLLVPVNTTADVVASPQLAARDFWREVDQPQVGSPVTYPGPFAKFSETPITYRRPPPLIGEHNAEVFAELGLDEAARRALFAQGVI